MTPKTPERHIVLNHQRLGCFFSSFLSLTTYTPKALVLIVLCKGYLPEDSLHKGPVMQKGFYVLTHHVYKEQECPKSLLIFPWPKWSKFRRRYFHMHFHELSVLYFYSNFTEFVPRGPIDNKSVLVQVIAWNRTGEKPLYEPKLIQLTAAYVRQYGVKRKNQSMPRRHLIYWSLGNAAVILN